MNRARPRRLGRTLAIQHWTVIVLVGLGLALAALAPISASADSLNWRKEKDSVDADITTWSLIRTLEKVAEATGWQIYVEPGTQRRVSTKFKDRPRDRALDFLIPNLGRALLPGTNGGPPRLLVFRNSQRDATRLIRSRDKGPKPIPNELIVTLKPGTNAEDLAKQLGAKIVGKSAGLNSVRLQFANEEATESAREALLNNEAVASVDPNFPITPVPVPENGSGPVLPNLKLAPVTAGQAIVIGLIDTAVQVQPGGADDILLQGVKVQGETSGPPPSDSPTHGTAMKDALRNGIAMSAEGDQGTRVRILPVDVYGNNATTTTYEVAEGVYQAMQKGANIINLSLGGEGDTPYLHDIIRKGAAAGYTFVASAGNEPVASPTFPAAYPEVIAVTAGDAQGRIASYANWGAFVDVMAPGNAYVNFNNQTYRVSGTSPAAAYISGAIAGRSDYSGVSLSQAAAAVIRAMPPPTRR